MNLYNRYHKGEYVGPSFKKKPAGTKLKRLTLFACGCDNGVKTRSIIKGFSQTIETYTCPHCNGTGKRKRIVSVQEKDYERLMKEDRIKAGMKYKGVLYE